MLQISQGVSTRLLNGEEGLCPVEGTAGRLHRELAYLNTIDDLLNGALCTSFQSQDVALGAGEEGGVGGFMTSSPGLWMPGRGNPWLDESPVSTMAITSSNPEVSCNMNACSVAVLGEQQSHGLQKLLLRTTKTELMLTVPYPSHPPPPQTPHLSISGFMLL